MITNNYTDTLPENKRSNADFFSIESPVLNIRMFEYNLVRDTTHLILPYYVGDSEHKDYVEEKTGPTFTTVFMFDEDKLSQDEVHVIKKTTYAGEQVIDLGTFSEEGIHSLSIYTVQSNGISSPTRFLQFIVRKPESEYTVVDLTELSEFNSSVTDHIRYYMPTRGYGHILASVYTRSYEVSVNNTGDISVTVKRLSGDPWHTVYNLKNETGALDSQTTGDNFETLDYELMQNQGNQVTYTLTEKCTINGVEHNLKDYIGYTETLPEEVIRAGVENKLALMYLFEAAKAVDEDNMVKLILPQMDIVCDYHFVDITKSMVSLVDIDVNRCCMYLPDQITIDLNGSTVYMLPITNNYRGRFFHGLYNTDTHIINGNIIGNWGNSTLSFTRQSGWSVSDGEHRSTILFQGCRFCSIEDLDVSYTVGYDVTCGSPVDGDNGWRSLYFDDLSYIDYDGNECTRDSQDDSICGYRLSTNYQNVRSKNQLFCAPVFMIHRNHNMSDTDKLNTKTCRTIFIHFYDENDEFLKTVKASQHWYILIPYGAVKAKVSAFGTICTSVDSDTPDFLMRLDTNKFCVYVSNVPSWCCSTERCTVHDTRQCVFLVGGVQNRVKDCVLYNVGAEKQSSYTPSTYGTFYSTLSPTEDYDTFAIYKKLVQIEEPAMYTFHAFWENVECLYADGTLIHMDGSRDMHIKNCHGISFSFSYPVADYLIEGCSYQILRLNHSWMSGPSHSVIRNCILKSLNNGGDHVSQSNCLGAGKYSGDLYLRNCDVLNEEGVLPIHDEPNIKS